MNQSAFAARLGVLPQHVTNWKSRGLPAEQYQPIAEALGRSIDELLGRTPETKTPRVKSNADWPLLSIDESKVRALSDFHRVQLEAAILIAAGQVGLDVKKKNS
ncbi:helix-turn-helix domain-containing protein [Pusillimonas sp. ANT_WB101]|uniref:helix-turn-helix domain-containing protein n=1 Tax=Pusillimonas sp. ANT_WB101 TaxID=2597356 RepID=UPI0011EF2D91|nr:helix-turn-helix domain-containing protein [Pusillimonas sp. ANT_WB101]KAA0911858.1 helix-turn-helix domain-containing protein [Pusillimonas sp. ANT_WB101]